MDITIDSENLSNVSSKMIQCADDLTININNISNVIDNINLVWSGQDALKYINTMREKYIVGLLELKDVVLEYAKYLEGVSDAYKVLDETFANKNIEV